MKSIPKNTLLYNKVKQYIYKKYPKHSAYRSGLLVQKYKQEFKKLHPLSNPYIGQTSKLKGLSRWFKEDWKSDTGKYYYSSRRSVYRPTKKITKKTPKTFSELSKKELNRAKYKKARYGRVNRF